MNHQLQIVPFYQDEIFIVDREGEALVPVKPISDNIGLDWKSQFRKIKADKERFCMVMMTIQLPSGNQRREMLCIPLKKLFGWLQSIDPSRVAPHLKKKIERYQQECDEVLWNYWTKGVGLPDRQANNYIAIHKDEYIELKDTRILYLERQLNPAGGPVTPAEIARFKRDILSGMGTSEVARKHLRSTATIKRYTVEERAGIRLQSGRKQLNLFSLKGGE